MRVTAAWMSGIEAMLEHLEMRIVKLEAFMKAAREDSWRRNKYATR